MAGNKTVYTLDLDTSKLISKYKDAISQMEKAGVSGDITKGLTQGLEKLEKEYKSLETAGKAGFTNSKQIENFQKRVEKLMTSFRGFESELGGVSKKIEDVAKKSSEANKKLSGAFSKFGFKDVAKQMDAINNATDREAKLSEIVKTELEARAKAVADLKAKYDQAAQAAQQASQKANSATLGTNQNSKYSSGESIWTSGKNKVDNSVKQAIVEQAKAIAKAAKDGEAAWAEFNNYLKANGLEKAFNQRALGPLEQTIKDMQSGFSAAAPAIEEANRALEELNAAEQSFNQIGKNTKDGVVARREAYNQLKAGVNEVEKAESGVSEVMEDAKASSTDMANAQNQAAKAAKDVAGAAISEEGAVSGLTSNLQQTAETAEKTASTFEKLKSRVLMFFSVTSIFNAVRNEIKKTYEDVKQLDKSFASIAMVTKYSVNEMWSSYSLYADMASQLGQKTNDVIQASALFYQQGLDTNEALALTTDTMKLATLAGTDFSSATQEMTSAIRGFKMEMDEGSRVADVYSNLAAHAAATVDDIAQAMARTASIANSAGMSFENTSAFLTQMIETTQESAENIGTSLKTIIARFTELKENVAGTADSEFEDLDYNKVDKALKSVGVSLKDATGQFRNLDEVFMELSQKWDTLDRNTQRYVATIAAGSRQQSRFIAMMDNYERTAELMGYAADAEGKADEQFAKYSDTMEYKLNQLSTKWEEFRVQLLNSDFFKGIIDSLNNLMDRLKNFDLKKTLPIIPFAIWAAKTFILNFIKTAQTTAKAASSIGKALSNTIAKALSKNKVAPEFNAKLAKMRMEKLMQDLNKSKNKFGDLTLEVMLEMPLQELEQGKTAVQLFEEKIKSAGGTSTEAYQALQKFAYEEGIIANESDGLADHIDEINAALQREANAAQNAAGQIEHYNNDSAKITARSQAIGSALQAMSSAATMALTGLLSGTMSGEEALDSFMNMMLAWCVQLTVQWAAAAIINKTGAEASGLAIGTGIDAGLAASGVGLIIVAIMASIALIYKFFKKMKGDDSAKKAAEEAKAISEGMEALNDQRQRIKENVKTTKDQYDETKNIKEEYEALSKKVHLTSEEQDRYNELIQEIQEKYPEIVTYYDEANNKLTIQNKLWEEILAKQKKNMEMAQQTEYEHQIMDVTNAYGEKYKNWKTKNNIQEDTEYGAAAMRDLLNTKTLRATSSTGYEYEATGLAGIAAEGLTKDVQIDISEVLFEDLGDIGSGTGNDRFRTSGGVNTLKTALEKQDAEGNKDLIDKIDKFYKAQSTEEAATMFNYDELSTISTALNDYANQTELSVELQKERNEMEKEYNATIAQNYAAQYKQEHKNATDAEALLYGAAKASAYEFKDAIDNSAVVKAIYDQEGGKEGTITLGGEGETELSQLLHSDNGGVTSYGVKVGDKDITFTRQELYDYWVSQYDTLQEAEEAWRNASEVSRTADFVAKKYNDLMAGEGEENWTKLQEAMGSDTELQDMLNKVITEGSKQEDIDAFKKYAEEKYKDLDIDFDAILKQFQDARNDFVAGLQEYGFTMSFKDLDAELGNSMIAHLDEQVAKGVNKESLRKYYSQMLSGLSTEAQEDMIHMLNVTDFSDISLGNIAEQKNKWIQEFKEMKKQRGEIISTEEAEKEWNKFFKIGEQHGAIDVKIKTVEGLQDIEDSVNDYVSKIVESSGKVASVLSDYAENEYINLSQYNELAKELEEVGLSVKDFTTATKEGFSVDVDKLEKAYQEQITSKDYLLKQAKQAIQEGVEELDNQIALLDALDEENNLNAQSLKLLAQKSKLTAEIAANTLKASGNVDAANAITTNVADSETIAYKSVKDSEYYQGLIEQRDGLKALLNDDKALSEKIGADILNAGSMENSRNFAKARGDAEDLSKAYDKMTDSAQKAADAYDDMIEKQEALNEKIKEYNELLYGKENRKSSLDVLYNYTEAINSFNDEISRSKELLADSKTLEESTAALTRYTQATHNLLVEEKAKQEVLKKGLANYENIIESGTSYTDELTGNKIDVDFSEYVKKDARTNKYIIDQRLLNEAKFADTWKDYLEQQVSDYNKYSEELLKSEDEVRKKEKELEDERNSARKNYVAMEKEIADALKQQYQDEVDALQSKYDSMKDADDDYLDALQEAIDKQRKLRDQENAYEDLAKQEKKLSLMQRDTSGANALEVQNLEEDIQKSREDLLDEAIDNVIDGLSKLYESQEELRNEEMELKQALLDNTLYWNQQAENLAGSFENADEYAAYLSSISKEYADMTLTMQQDKLAEYGDTYTQATEYMAMISMDSASETHDFINDTITTTGEEVKQVVAETAETFSTEVIRSYNETTEAFNEDMKKAKDAIDEANKSLEEAKKKYAECAQAANEAADAYNRALAAQNGGGGGYSYEPEPTPEPEEPAWKSATTVYGIANGAGIDHNELDDMSSKTGDTAFVVQTIKMLKNRGLLTEEMLDKILEAADEDKKVQLGSVVSEFITDLGHDPNNDGSLEYYQKRMRQRYAFAEGGLVNFTGPAWVDGTPGRPEAFLSAEDTENIGNAAKILADIPWLDRTTSNGQVITNNGGDVSVEINLNIDHISSETDIDEMLERVKEEIVEVARPAGTNTILQQEI